MKLSLCAVLFLYTELANSNKPEEEDTLPSQNECSHSDNHCNSNSQCVNDNEATDENKNLSSRGDDLGIVFLFYLVLYTVCGVDVRLHTV